MQLPYEWAQANPRLLLQKLLGLRSHSQQQPNQRTLKAQSSPPNQQTQTDWEAGPFSSDPNAGSSCFIRFIGQISWLNQRFNWIFSMLVFQRSSLAQSLDHATERCGPSCPRLVVALDYLTAPTESKWWGNPPIIELLAFRLVKW